MAIAAIAALSATTSLAGVVQLSSFQAGDAGWHLGTLAVGQLDADAQLEIVVPYRNASGAWFLDAFKPNGTRLSGFPYAGGGSEINVSPTLSDLDGDGRDEILFTCGANVLALRGNGTVLWSSAVNSANYVPNSGFMTVVTNGFFWTGTNSPFLNQLPDTAVFSSQVSSPMVATFNGQKLVVTGWKIDPDSLSNDQDFNPFINDIWGSGEWGTMGESWSGGVIFFNAATGARDYTYHIHQLVESGLALGRADASGPLKTYVLNDSDSVVCFDKTRPHGFYGNGNLHGQFGKNQRLMSGAYQQGVDVSTADIDGDGLSEVLVPTTQLNPLWQPADTILDDDGAILWRKWKQAVSFPLNQWQNNACLIPVNPDRDNRADVLGFTHSFEITFRTWNGTELVDRPGWPKSFHPYLPTPPVVGDVDGDGHEEIVIGTYNPAADPSSGSLQVFSLNGTLEQTVTIPGGLKHIPTIANVQGNGLAVVCRSLNGRVYIYSFGSASNGSVSWATHRGNKQRDGNLNVPLFPAGTPIVTNRTGGNGRAQFAWMLPPANQVRAWRIYRADSASGPYSHLMTLTAAMRSCTDHGLESGRQYFYEVAAVYDSGEVRSAPFPVLSTFNDNLIRNSGFEENSDCRWDKWFTGEIDWSNMTASVGSCRGDCAMKITFTEDGNGGSISQFGQYGTPDGSIPATPGKLYSFGGFFRSSGLSQETQHWFEWSSTPNGENPNARPARPYPGYFTPMFRPGTNATGWVYANRTFVLPDGCPNVELTHWYTTAGPVSGSVYLDDLFIRPLPDPNSTNWTTLIPFNANWRYSIAPQANWFAANFNDSAWPVGMAKFGAGGGPRNLVTPLPAALPAYYFRRNFVLPNGTCEELLLSAMCTDEGTALEVYLNGTRLDTTGIEATSAHGNTALHYDLTPFVPLLKPGMNQIAVMLRNNFNFDWDDVAFDVSLKTVIAPPRTFGLRMAQPGANPNAAQSLNSQNEIGVNVTVPSDTIWRVESADRMNGPWQLMQVISNTGPETVTLPDLGQNGRLPPSATPTRFYRLMPN